ncbi:MAG: NADAR family protein [Planctomycetota bacterium]
MEWRYPLNGSGLEIPIPKGMYSSDTQLRLATCRNMLANARFDAETFAKVELVVWRSYAFAGRSAVKAAAKPLMKPDVRWNSNFFSDDKADYFRSSGSEVATRIQPHVLAAPPSKKDSEVLKSVIENIVVTNGHPNAIVGASFHALCLCESYRESGVLDTEGMLRIVGMLEWLPDILRTNDSLREIWLSVWEDYFGRTLDAGLKKAVADLRSDISKIQALSPDKPHGPQFDKLLSTIPHEDEQKIALRVPLLASCLAFLCQKDPLSGMALGLRSGCDGVPTLLGAILGLCVGDSPPQRLVDHDYVVSLAERLHEISVGREVRQFPYPDLLGWQPPRAELDYVRTDGDTWQLVGFGEVEPVGEVVEQSSKNAALWQWFKLSFGQHILLKRRPITKPVDGRLLPFRQPVEEADSKNRDTFTSAKAWQLVVDAHFNEAMIGNLLLELAGLRNGVEQCREFAERIAVNLRRADKPSRDGDIPLTLESLKRCWQAGERHKFLFFYSHRPPSVGVDESCFSQWYERKFSVGRQEFLTAEHWMMAEKARIFGDHRSLERILDSSSPKAAKSLGRKVVGFDAKTWELERVRVVYEGNLAKFSQHDDLRSFLCSTRNAILVEAAKNDSIWGIGLAASDSRCKDPAEWKGKNLLGFVLTRIREELKA